MTEIEHNFIRSETERLLSELENINTPHQRRSVIGERLAAIGDTRPGVGLRPDGLPDIVWCTVPGGKMPLLGREAVSFTVHPFYIAKYPITYVQFQSFLNDPEGFDNAVWWVGFANDAWWMELTEEFPQVEMTTQYSRFDNHPRDSVSWYQAIAFCRWLSTKLPEEAWPERLERTGKGGRLLRRKQDVKQWVIRLPTEWEWQQAATGSPITFYPWDNAWDHRRANTYEAGLSRTTAVGIYPQGASSVGAMDMSGNVWEWGLNEYSHPKNIGVDGERERVLRGGAFNCISLHASCFHRYSRCPVYAHPDLGFRVSCGVSLI